MDMKKSFWTESEAAEKCGVPYWRLKYLRDCGKIHPLKIGRTLIYSETDVVIARALVEAQGDRYRRMEDEWMAINKKDEVIP